MKLVRVIPAWSHPEGRQPITRICLEKKPNSLLTLMILSLLSIWFWPATEAFTRQDRLLVTSGVWFFSREVIFFCSPGPCLHSPCFHSGREGKAHLHRWDCCPTFMTSAFLVVPLKAQLDQKYWSHCLSTQNPE